VLATRSTAFFEDQDVDLLAVGRSGRGRSARLLCQVFRTRFTSRSREGALEIEEAVVARGVCGLPATGERPVPGGLKALPVGHWSQPQGTQGPAEQ
jgi:hypothetical protein